MILSCVATHPTLVSTDSFSLIVHVLRARDHIQPRIRLPAVLEGLTSSRVLTAQNRLLNLLVLLVAIAVCLLTTHSRKVISDRDASEITRDCVNNVFKFSYIYYI